MKTVVVAVVLAGTSALACKIATPPPYDASAGSADAPPTVSLQSVNASLGRNFGGPGPGDCSELGELQVALRSPDGAALDGRFGAKLIVTSGELPAAIVDLSTWVAPIKDNKVKVVLKGQKPSVDFTVAVQLVNATGAIGEQSAAVRETGSAGCSVAGVFPLSALALLAFRGARRRRP